MRIVHCFRAPVGGLFRHVLDLAGAQAAAGHDVGLIADNTATDELTGQRLAAIAPQLSLGIARIAMPRQPSPADFAAHRAVVAHAAGLALDVLHGHGAKGGAFARLAGRTLKARGQPVKVFYTPHGGTLNYKPGSLKSRIFMGLERIFDPMTDGLIFESAFAARVYGERVGAGRAARLVVHNGLKAQDFAAQRPNADAADLLFIGELRPIKGVDVLLKALAVVNAGRDTPLTAVIVGSGPDAEALQSQAIKLGLARSVRFAGAMPAALALPMGRTMAVPSRKESFPYVVLEAAAAGMPLISTDVGGISEIVEGTDTALIAAGDIAGLAAAIEAVTGDVKTAQQRAGRLRAAVSARFTVEQMTRSILAFYEQAAAEAVPMASSHPAQQPA